MSWSRTICALALLLGACGFQPVNGPGAAGSSLIGQVAVSAPSDRNTFLLVQRLEERMGRAVDPAYLLDLTLSLSEEGLAENLQGELRRFNILGRVEYTLTTADTGEIATSGTVQNFTGYASAGTTVATQAAREDAFRRLMTILADQIVVRLQVRDPAS